MNKKIGRKTYDTEKAQLIARKASGCFGDAAGFEEMLYQKARDEFFLFGQGGSSSVYPEAAIVPLTLDQARTWLSDVVGSDSAVQICQQVEVKESSASKRSASKAAPRPASKTAAAKTTKAKAAADSRQ